MTNLKFKFYSVLKNEDAMPFFDDNILVVADGLGGSGSAVHAIDRQRHADMSGDIWASAFGDIKDTASSRFQQYVNDLIVHLSDGKDDTSASWASRIAIARCVYALTEGEFKNARLDDKNVREALTKFISKGLHDAAEKFDLQNGKFDGQRLLPTTLAFIRFAEQEHSVVAETIWAGDSRCYALLPDGLRLLSVDDEDNSGSITNLFYADNPNVSLNYLRHEIAKPCVLMGVSDGVFDPFDPYDYLYVEYVILKAIEESNSTDELAKRLERFFDDVHGDDATMAFVPFGMESFEEMKKVFKPRYELIATVRQKQADLQSALDVMNLSDEDASHYVGSRIDARFEYIVPTLLDAIENGKEDIAITDEIRNVVQKASREKIAEIVQNKTVSREQALGTLFRFVKDHPESVNTEVFDNEETKVEISDVSNTVSAFKTTADALVKQYAKADEYQTTLKRYEETKQRLHNEVLAKIKAISQEFDDLWALKNSSEIARKRDGLCEILRVWCRIDNSVKFCWSVQDVGKLNQEDRRLAWDVQDYVNDTRDLLSNIKTCSVKIDEYRTKYNQLWKGLFQMIATNSQFELILSKEIRQKFSLGSPQVFSPTNTDSNAVRSGVIQILREQKSAFVANIVSALAKHYDETSIIDAQFNAGRLSQFRTYYKLKSHPDESIGALNEQLTAMKQSYASLVKLCKK